MPIHNRTPIAIFAAGLMVATGMVGCKSKPSTIPGIQMYVAGVKAYRAGDQQLAISNLVTATETNDNLIMAAALLGDLYKANGEYEKARDAYSRVATLDPYTYSSFYNLGVTYQLLHQLREAAANYQKSLALKPDHLESNMNLGLVKLALGDVDEAIASLKKATELDPKNAAAWANLGVALDAKGDYAAAETAYQTSLDLKSDERSTLLNLGANLVMQKKGKAAIAVLQQALEKGDEPFAHKQYGDALALLGRFDEAIAQYDTAVKQNPQYVAAINEKGNAYIAQYEKGLQLDDSKRAAALEAWKSSLKINPEQPRIKETINKWEKGGV
jgi:tetratricopeptide (TPR) repeat protein